MTTDHHWFRSGDHSILAHLDLPAIPARAGVVIVPPFGWDDICAYRPLRSLARSLAVRGIATLRFDLPGTGDSSGSALDHKLISAWIRSVQDAVAELKQPPACKQSQFSECGLAACSPWRRPAAEQRWRILSCGAHPRQDARCCGNYALSEIWRSPEFAEGEAAPPQPIDGPEVAGFLLNRRDRN